MKSLLNPDVPLHYQIYLQLRSEIQDGLWVGRDDFPGEAELADRFGVSVITSRHALTRLGEDGWIARGRGRRTRVLKEPIVRTGKAPVMFPIGPERPYTYAVLSHGQGMGNAEACAAFGRPPGSALWLCSRVRSFKGKAHSLTMNAQRIEVGARHSIADLRRLPMTVLLEKLGFRAATMTRRTSAAAAPETVARNLEVPLHSPVLLSTFTMSDVKGEAIEWVRIYLHPDQPSPVEQLDLNAGTWRYSEPP